MSATITEIGVSFLQYYNIKSGRETMRYVLYLCTLCALWPFSARAQTDLTRTADSYGPLVVESTIQLLRDACLIKDHLLLERIAAFETNDGLAIMPGDHGGIWQVTNTINLLCSLSLSWRES